MDNYSNPSSLLKLFTLACVIKAIIMLSSCTSTMGISDMKSSNSSFRVKTLVMHFTAVNYEDSVKYLVKEGGGVSSHYLIPMQNDETYPNSSIKVLKLVDENERAWHAGVSHWQGRDGLNDTSIGIEIVNVPECIEQQTPAGFVKPRPVCIFPEFENKQIELLIELSRGILERNPDITPTAVVGHSDIAPSRKNDPGPRFPWQKLYEAGIGAWYENEAVAKYWNIFNQKPVPITLVQKALSTYGYKVAATGVFDRQTQDVLAAFQLHFVPWQVDGLANNQTVATLFALLEKYFPDSLISLLDEFNSQQSLHNAPKFVNQSDFGIDLSALDSESVNKNKIVFLSNGVTSELKLSSVGIKSADIYINEQKINLGDYFNAYDNQELHEETFSIGKRTVQGRNSLRVDNIEFLSGFMPEVTLDLQEKEALFTESVSTIQQGQDIKESDIETDATTGTLIDVDQPLAKKPKLHISITYPTLNVSDEAVLKDKRGLQYNFDKLDTWLEQGLDEQLHGAAIVVIHRGRVVKHDVYGYAQTHSNSGNLLSNPIKMNKQTMFDMGENTQPLATTLAIMKLVDQGILSLNKSVTHYLKEYKGNNREVVTISDLLSHSSGYQATIDFYDLDNPFGEYLYSLQPELTKQYLLTRVPFSAQRGQQQHSDINYMILGILVERVTGMALDEYVEKHIYEPLGLTKTLFNPLKKGMDDAQFVTHRLPPCQIIQTDILSPNQDCSVTGEVLDRNALFSMQGVSGHAGLFSSSNDLAIVAQMLLNGGGYGYQSLFSQEVLDNFTQSEILTSNIGFGWKLGHHHRTNLFGPYASANVFGHISKTGSSILIDPDLELAIITLVNQHKSKDENTDNYSLTQFNPMQVKLNSMIYESIFEASTHYH